MHKSILFATVAVIATIGPLTDLRAAAPASNGPAANAASSAPAARPPATPTPLPVVDGNALDRRMEPLPPVLQKMRDDGVKITALGESHGLSSYFTEHTGTGMRQVVTLSPDGLALIPGPFQELSPNGRDFVSITLRQIDAMAQRVAAARAEVEAQRRRADEERRKADEASRALDAQGAQAVESMRQFNAGLTGAAPAAPVPVTAPAAAQPSVPTPATGPIPMPVAGPQRSDAAPATGDRYASTRDLAVFTAALEQTAYFTIGREGNPTVYLVADPQCPHCHEAWKELRPRIEAGALTVKVILVAGLPGSDRLAVNLLGRDNPGRAYFEGEGSVKGVAIAPSLGAEQSRTGQGFLDVNMAFLRQADIRGTPWMGYVGKDGKLREMSGDTNIPAFLGAL